jgi:hypothetical protein
MSDTERPEGPADFPAEGVSLGGLEAGEFDRTLGAGDEGLEPEGAEEGRPPAAPPSDADDLGLPRGGLVAFRKSGGLRFRSRGVAVYRSGWVVPLTGTAGKPRRMTAEALGALEALVTQSGLGRKRLAKTAAGARDGYFYEITARFGGRTRYAETADGAIPEDLGRLIAVLQRLLPREA